MKTSIDSIRNGLVAQLADLDRDLTEVVARVNDLKTTRRQVGAAIKALGGKDSGAGLAKPAPKKAQVQKTIGQLLTDNNGEIALKDIEALVADKLASEHGCSAMGLALRMREVLAASEFTTVDGQLRRSSGTKITADAKR